MPRWCCFFVLLAWTPAVAQEANVQVRKLTVSPAPMPSPALRYRLLPEIRDLKPGNAALLWQRAHSPEWYSSLQRWEKFSEKISDWLDVPLDQFPKEVGQQLQSFTGLLTEIDLAARKQYCDWDMVQRLRKEGMTMLIPEIQAMRTFSNLNSLRIRRELKEKKFDQALRALQTNIALARDVGDGPTLIHGLVGLAILGQSGKQIEDWMQVPDSPNLYWGLTDLPSAAHMLQKNLQGERLMVDSLFPEIREAIQDPSLPPIPPARITAALEIMGKSTGEKLNQFLALGFLSLKVYPDAKRYFLKQGHTEEQLQTLGLIQVSVMYLVVELDRHFDEIYKWNRVPYWQARAGLKKGMEELRNAKKDLRGGSLLASLLLPAIEKVLQAYARVDRMVSAYRIIEALRHHAHLNQGQFPARLSDIQDLPIPIDIATGEPFPYRREQDHAVLSIPRPADWSHPEVRFEIRIREP